MEVFENDSSDDENGNVIQKRTRSDSEDEDSDDDNDFEEEDEELEPVEILDKPRRKKEKESRPKKRNKASSKNKFRNFFADEADVADDDEEEEEYDERERGVDDEALAAEELEANLAVERRHEQNRRFQEQSASELAQQYEERYRSQTGYRPGRGGMSYQPELMPDEVQQQSLIPGVNDPGIWAIRCKTGSEQSLVRSVLLKTMHNQANGKPVLIKSCFCTASAGFVYIEAMEEPFVREAINGLSGFFYSTLAKVPLAEMTSLLTVTVRKKPIKVGQWCRMKRGPLKGDLVRIVRTLEGGTRALVQAVPRPDFEHKDAEKKALKSSRPIQRMFLSEDAISNNHTVDRRRYDGEYYEFWNGEMYKHGFMFKEVKVDTFLHTGEANPRLNELAMFRESKRNDGDHGYDEEEEEEEDNYAGGTQNIMKELAKQLDEEELKKKEEDRSVPLRVGDMVMVIGDGDLRNMKGKIVKINEIDQLAEIKPILKDMLLENIRVETSLLVKDISPGNHVKVVSGAHMGQTGRVVSVYRKDGDHVAAILTDGINTEITCNVSHLQVSNEVTTGLHSLAGYELYDLVMLSANEYAVVVYVGTDHLKVLTQYDNEKTVRPVEIKAKKMAARGTTGAFDHMKNPLAVGDTVSVLQGQYSGKSGTIKHINRSVLWLHSTSYLKNSSIFVVKGKSVVLAGGQAKDSAATTAAVLNATYVPGGAPSVTRGARTSGKGGSRDAMIGKTVKLRQGTYKGMIGHITDATETSYWIELHGKLKKINVPKDKVTIAGDRHGAVNSEGVSQRSQDFVGVPSTPFLTAQTPNHTGAETPMYNGGGETPNLGNTTPSGNATPGRNDDFDVWRPNSTDVVDPVSSVGAPGSSWGDSDWKSSGHVSDASVGSSSGWGGGWQSSSSATHSDVGGSLAMYEEWDSPMLVVFKSGRQSGSVGVIEGRIQPNGQINVRLEDDRTRTIFSFPAAELRLITPRKKDMVKVIGGPRRGFVGKVQMVDGDDVFIDDDIFKISQVATLN